MSGENKTLSETIDEGVAETKANAETAQTEAAETKKEMSQDTSTETKTGETEREYVSGIDISDIPVQDRPKIKEYLSKKAKLLEDGYQGKFKEISTFKKAQEDLIAAGLSVDEARDVLNKHLESKRNPPAAKEKALKTLDKLISESPYEQRGSLEQMRQIILEETEVPDLKKKVDQLEQIVNALGGSARETRRDKLNTELNTLSETYGKDLTEKYKDVIVGEGLKYPNLTTRQILFYVVPPDELEETILAKKGVKKPIPIEKKNAISSQPSAMTSAQEIGDPKKNWMEEWMAELKKK